MLVMVRICVVIPTIAIALLALLILDAFTLELVADHINNLFEIAGAVVNGALGLFMLGGILLSRRIGKA